MFRLIFRILVGAIVLGALALAGYRMAASMREVDTVEALTTFDSRFTETVHGVIHSLEVGLDEAPPVLLVHGSIGWAGFWSDTAMELDRQGFRAIGIDLPPMGLSQRQPRMDFSRQAQALRILALVEAKGIKPVIVAHSFGAGPAMEAVLIDPDAFAGAVVIAGALALGEDGAGRELPALLRPKGLREAVVAVTATNPHLTDFLFNRIVHRKDTLSDGLKTKLLYPLTRVGTTAAVAEWLPTLLIPPKGAVSSDPAKYGGLEVPVALIWGREDSVTPPDQALALQIALGEAPIFWIEDAGHVPQVESPEAFHEALAEALAAVAKN